MSNAIFPALPGQKMVFRKKVIFKTRIQESESGKEIRIAKQAYPRYEFTLSWDMLRQNVNFTTYSELRTAVGHFLQMRGKQDDFLFLHPEDNAITVQQNIGTGSGVAGQQFQLVRDYGGFVEPVQNVNGAIVLRVGGTIQTLGTNYTVGATGIVTSVTAFTAAAAVTWTGGYYYRCRNVEDELEFERFVNNFWDQRQTKFVSVKL